MSKTLDILIKTSTKGLSEAKKLTNTIYTGFSKCKEGVEAFNSTAGRTRSTISTISASLTGLVGAYLGFEGLSRVTQVMKDAELAGFNMASSIQAAGREFDDTGSLADWERSVRSMSDALVIYSDSALKSAVSRTIDMTKRLGLSREQMELVIKRSADLGAGKVELVDAVERVTAALRGEAEASEYLGLTLNETYVRAWYEASDAYKTAWKDLTDLEKAQIRYQILLEQSDSLQGKAANSADTFAGAMALIAKETENAITKNKDVASAMGDIADALRENSGEIGTLISQFVGLIAKVIEFGIKYKNILLIIAGTGAAVTLISKLALAVKGLNAAFTVMTGMSILKWFSGLGGAITPVLTAIGSLSTAMKVGLVGAIAFTVIQIGKLVRAFGQWRDAANEVKEAQERMYAITDMAMERYKAFRDVKMPDDITGNSYEELEKLNTSMEKSAFWWESLMKQMRQKSTETNWFGIPTEEANFAKSVLDYVTKRFNDATEAAKRANAELSKMTKPEGVSSSGSAGTPTLTPEQREKIAADQKRLEEQLASELIEISGDKWTVLRNKARAHYDEELALANGRKDLILNAEKVYHAELSRIRDAQNKEILDKEKAQTAAQISSRTERFQEMAKTALAKLQSTYGKAGVSMEEYFAKRRALIDDQYAYETGQLTQQLNGETDESEKLQIEDQLFALKEQHTRDLISLNDEELAAKKALADKEMAIEQTLADMRSSIRGGASSALQAQFDEESAAMDRMHKAEIERLKELTASYDDAAKAKAVIDEADMLQKMEKNQLVADQEARLANYRLRTAAGLAGDLSDVFNDLYQATGENNKALFSISQGLAVAEATMRAYSAANKALDEGGPILGKIQAAIILAQGMANVAKIKAQTLAYGGPVLGYSPTPTADNVPIWATAGEFMHPVHIVKQVGLDFMEFVRQGRLTRAAAVSLMKGLPVPSIPSYNSFALAGGGAVPAGASNRSVAIEMYNTFTGVNDATARQLADDFEARVINVMRRELR